MFLGKIAYRFLFFDVADYGGTQIYVRKHRKKVVDHEIMEGSHVLFVDVGDPGAWCQARESYLYSHR